MTHQAAILAAHDQGLLNREIAAVVGCHHRTVAYWLSKSGRESNLKRGAPPETVDAEHSRCRECSAVVRNDEFPFVRNRQDGRRLSTCRRCRADQARRAISDSPASYFRERHRRLVRGERGGRRSRSGIAYSLPEGYLHGLWVAQSGACFYTGEPMTMTLAAGRTPDGVSIDRVDPAMGYEVGNVVLCRTRVNTIKSDVSPDELRAWMPGWHARVLDMLPGLVERAHPIVDDAPVAVNGRRLPTWVVERRARMAALNAPAAPNNF